MCFLGRLVSTGMTWQEEPAGRRQDNIKIQLRPKTSQFQEISRCAIRFKTQILMMIRAMFDVDV